MALSQSAANHNSEAVSVAALAVIVLVFLFYNKRPADNITHSYLLPFVFLADRWFTFRCCAVNQTLMKEGWGLNRQ